MYLVDGPVREGRLSPLPVPPPVPPLLLHRPPGGGEVEQDLSLKNAAKKCKATVSLPWKIKFNNKGRLKKPAHERSLSPVAVRVPEDSAAVDPAFHKLRKRFKILIFCSIFMDSRVFFPDLPFQHVPVGVPDDPLALLGAVRVASLQTKILSCLVLVLLQAHVSKIVKKHNTLCTKLTPWLTAWLYRAGHLNMHIRSKVGVAPITRFLQYLR